MSKFKKAKVVMLPSNEKATIGDLGLSINVLNFAKNNDWINIYNPIKQHLYIISDDEIKEGDWCLIDNNKVGKRTNKQVYPNSADGESHLCYYYTINGEEIGYHVSHCKKIISTTDTSLEIFDKELSDMHSVKVNILLPEPSQQFIQKYIEEYNKNNIITDVLVEYESDFNSCFCTKDICNGNNCPKKLKINPKDNTITIKIVKDCYTREEVVKLLVDCCGEVSCEDGKLLGKNPEELYKWIEENL